MTTPDPSSQSLVPPPPPSLGPVGRRTPAGWVLAIIGFALLFSLVLPVAVFAGPEERPAQPGERLSMMFATVEAQDGWSISIAESSLSAPAMTRGEVRAEFTSGLWEGSTESLLERAVDLNVEDPATATIPPVDESEDRADRSIHRIVVDGPDSQGDVYVVRELSVVVMVVVRGSASDRDAAQADLDAMIDSLILEELDLSIEEVEL